MENNLKNLQQMMKERSKIIAEEKTALMDLVGPWLDFADKSKVSNEEKDVLKKDLNELGKFIVSSQRKILIDKVDFKAPKFVVSRNRSRVAVEMFDMDTVNDSKQLEETYRLIFDKVEAILIEEGESFHGVYDVQFEEQVDILGSQEEITKELVQNIKEGTLDKESTFVKSIKKTQGGTVYLHSDISNEGVTLLKTEVESVLASREKAFNQNQKGGIDSHWLILVLGGVQDMSDYTFLENDMMSHQFESSFDKVFLFDSFSEEIIELK